MPFELGKKYTRREIHNILSGGSVQSYLPTINGKVVAGCFRTDWNTLAPDVIFIGKGLIIEGSARQLLIQGNYIPVFLKRVPYEWEYVGEFQAIKLENNVRDFQEVVGTIDINRVSGLLYLKKREDK